MGTKNTDGEERKVLDRHFSMGGSEVSTLNDLIVVWRLVIRGCEKVKLVDVHI